MAMFPSIIRHSIRQFRGIKAFQTTDLQVNITRTYVRWVSRRPSAIVNERKVIKPIETTVEPPVEYDESEPQISSEKMVMKKSKKSEKSSKTGPYIKKTSRYEILGEKDHIITSLMTSVKSRKMREKNCKILLEGHRLIQDGIDADAVPKVILFSRDSDLDKLTIPNGVEVYKVPYKTLQLWSNLTTSPGLIGIFETPDVTKKDLEGNVLPLTIICDNVREPGNLGAILRVAAGVGCERLILMKGCVDLWDPKVLRSASGAHFRLPINYTVEWEEIPSLVSQNCSIFITDSDPTINYTSEIFESKTLPDEDESNEKSKSVSKQKLEAAILREKMKQFISSLPILPYYSVDYTEREVVLVVSGETEGLSVDSCRFLNEMNSVRINIPLHNEVDSLNAGVALGIVTFELKRQFIKKLNEL